MIVGPEDARPAGKPDECFYCHEPMGAEHKPECVCRHKMVRVRMTVEFDHETVEAWTKAQIEFHLNDSSFCLDNLLAEIKARSGCLCPVANCVVIGGKGLFEPDDSRESE